MADSLLEGEFELDGYRFGTPENPAVILAGRLDTGAPALCTQDADNPVGDGGLFGRDYLSGPTWAFTLGVRHGEDVYTTLAELAAVWRNGDVRTKPGAVSTLRFRRHGKTYRAYGRPRRFGVVPSEVADPEWQVIEADFQVAEPFMYSDDEDFLLLSLIESAPDGGLVLPAELPWELDRTTNTGHGVITVESVIPAPFVLEVSGPTVGSLSKVRVSGAGWEIGLDLTIAYDETVVVNTRDMTVTKNGVSVAGALTRRSRLSARLQPGTQEVRLEGNDPSNTATARLSWRATSPIL